MLRAPPLELRLTQSFSSLTMREIPFCVEPCSTKPLLWPSPNPTAAGVRERYIPLTSNQPVKIGTLMLTTGGGNANGVGDPTGRNDGVPVVPGVPEPSTWAMMLLGFAGLGFAFRQSRRRASFA
jgi:hypothetical protein